MQYLTQEVITRYFLSLLVVWTQSHFLPYILLGINVAFLTRNPFREGTVVTIPKVQPLWFPEFTNKPTSDSSMLSPSLYNPVHSLNSSDFCHPGKSPAVFPGSSVLSPIVSLINRASFPGAVGWPAPLFNQGCCVTVIICQGPTNPVLPSQWIIKHWWLSVFSSCEYNGNDSSQSHSFHCHQQNSLKLADEQFVTQKGHTKLKNRKSETT